MYAEILFDGDRPHNVGGALRAAYVLQASAQAIVNAVDFGMTMTEAIAAPCINMTKNQIVGVSKRIPQYVIDEVEEMYYGLICNYLNYAFARVHGVKAIGDDWKCDTDPGRDDVALVV
jgi:gamma-glutamyltranspeptidase/glutathione hydrolase